MNTGSGLPNRVDPFGTLFATPERGLFMGVRGGRFHRDDKTLGRRRWTSPRWICCAPAFKGRRNEVWGRRYTQMFFMDEVTALAAGHRPCAECRHERFVAYRAAIGGGRADAIDRALDAERRVGHAKRAHRLDAATLPDGAVVVIAGDAIAKRDGRALRWSPAGWTDVGPWATGPVEVLTPPTSLAALAAGFAPVWGPMITVR